MSRYPSITPEVGEVWNRLTIIKVLGRGGPKNRWMVKCRCSCGTVVERLIYLNLRSGNTASCGCYQRERVAETFTTHGAYTDATSPQIKAILQCWKSMHQRCREQWRHYEGISVCKAWEKFEPFRDWALANGHEIGLTIDRINFRGNYKPSNCRWATPQLQARNRSTNRLLTFEGETKTLVDWAEDPRCAVEPKTFKGRIHAGWEIEEALKIPLLRRDRSLQSRHLH